MVAKGQDDQGNAGRKPSLQSRTQIPRQEQEGRGVRNQTGDSDSNQKPGWRGTCVYDSLLGWKNEGGSAWLAVLTGSCCEFWL